MIFFYISVNKEWVVSNIGFVNGVSFESFVFLMIFVFGMVDVMLYFMVCMLFGFFRYYVI